MSDLNTGDTSWILVSTALVLVMMPGLALFYGGLVRSKNVLSTFMHTLVALGLVSLQWTLLGYSLAFGPDVGGVIGNLDHVFLGGVGLEPKAGTAIPHLLFMVYQMMFAAITPALISGAFAERMSFKGFVVFTLLWSTLVYDPLAHWLWAPGGWLAARGALDFAGGIVVHVSSGFSALIVALILGARLGHPRERFIPHNLTMTLLGAGLLWFGWFGFNGGSALAANGTAVLALVNSQLAAAAAALTWMVVDLTRWQKSGSLGFASGFVAGLATVTPTAGFVGPMAAIIIGVAAGLACYGGVLVKEKLGYDDSLDAFGIHGVGGLVGTVLLGVFATTAWNSNGADGLVTGTATFFNTQLIAVGVSILYTLAMTYGLLRLVDLVVGLRVPADTEREGLDLNLHGEQGYVFGTQLAGQATPVHTTSRAAQVLGTAAD